METKRNRFQLQVDLLAFRADTQGTPPLGKRQSSSRSVSIPRATSPSAGPAAWRGSNGLAYCSELRARR